MARLHKNLGEGGIGSFGGVKSCKANRAKVTVSLIPCEAEMLQVRASEIPDLVTCQVEIVKLEQSVSRRRSSPGKTWCLSQSLGKGPKVQEWVLNRLRAHVDIQAAHEHRGAWQSKEELCFFSQKGGTTRGSPYSCSCECCRCL